MKIILEKYIDDLDYADSYEDEDSSSDDNSELESDEAKESVEGKSDEAKESVEEKLDESEEPVEVKSGKSKEPADEKSDESEKPVEVKSDKSEEPADEKLDQENDLKDDVVFPFLIGKKIGMVQLFSAEGNVFPATVIEAGPCSVTQIKSTKTDGYNAIQLGFLNKKSNKTNKSLIGHFNKSNTDPKKHIKEFRLNKFLDNIDLGDSITVSQFQTGDLVNVSGISKGKGFAGHMKRHGFSGGRASHGKNSVMRKSGSVGAGTDPGRIFPGMKMAGRMGNDKVTVKNLNVLNINRDKNLIFIKGSIPGANNNIIYLTKVI